MDEATHARQLYRQPILHNVKNNQLSWYGHISRMREGQETRKARPRKHGPNKSKEKVSKQGNPKSNERVGQDQNIWTNWLTR